MTPQVQLEIEAACIRLQQRYGTLADRQDPKFRELFTPDATIDIPSYPQFTGLDAIMEGQRMWCESDILMRHLCTNFAIEIDDTDHAHGICYMLVFHGRQSEGPEREAVPDMPISMAEFHDTFVRAGGRWLFRSRFLKKIFRGSGPPI